MRRFTPIRADRGAPLARTNPVAKLAAAAILMAAAFLATGPLAPALVLATLVASLPLSGLPTRVLLARSWPLLVAAASVGLLNVLLAPAVSGGPDLARAAALALRLLGVAFSGLLAVAGSDPTELADALQQQAHLSPRVAIGALAAVRMLPLLAVEWQVLGMARRARGVGGGRSPVAAARLGFGMLIALLVGSVRRATRLAMAMEARGFGAVPCRTIARPRRMQPADWGLIVCAAAVGAAAIAVGLLAPG